MEKKFELLVPVMPNFISLKMPVNPRQGGFNPKGSSIPVSDLSEEEAISFSELMKQAFIEHWKNKKNRA